MYTKMGANVVAVKMPMWGLDDQRIFSDSNGTPWNTLERFFDLMEVCNLPVVPRIIRTMFME